MASWCPPSLLAFVALAALGLGGLGACKQASAERQIAGAAGGSAEVASALPSALALASATVHEEDHDCSLHSPAPRGPVAPSATTLSPEARAKVTMLQVLAHGSAVIVRKAFDGWVMGGPNGCAVSSQRVQRALDSLSSLAVVPSNDPPRQHDRQIILLDESQVLLQYDVGVGAGGADPARLPDGSVVELRGLERALLSSQPADWCEPAR